MTAGPAAGSVPPVAAQDGRDSDGTAHLGRTAWTTWSGAFVERAVDEAIGAGTATVGTGDQLFAGRGDGAVLIRDALPGAKVRTVAFVNKRAISAGTLIRPAATTTGGRCRRVSGHRAGRPPGSRPPSPG